MSKIRHFYNSLYNHTWRLAFLGNTIENLVNGEDINLIIVDLPFKNRWFADPFILDVTESEIILLCEEYSDSLCRGRIAKVFIDRQSLTIRDWKIILDLPTHLSFPVILRLNDEVYIYPENSQNGGLKMYKYNKETDDVSFVKDIINIPVTDAIICKNLFGKDNTYLFATTTEDPNGSVLNVYKECSGKFEIQQRCVFSENIARMAGDFFYIKDKVYRPAQECNHEYGHAIDIQRVYLDDNNLIKFNSIRRIESPCKHLGLGMHTINNFKDVVVVDLKGYRHPKLVKVINFLKKVLFI